MAFFQDRAENAPSAPWSATSSTRWPRTRPGHKAYLVSMREDLLRRTTTLTTCCPRSTTTTSLNVRQIFDDGPGGGQRPLRSPRLRSWRSSRAPWTSSAAATPCTPRRPPTVESAAGQGHLRAPGRRGAEPLPAAEEHLRLHGRPRGLARLRRQPHARRRLDRSVSPDSSAAAALAGGRRVAAPEACRVRAPAPSSATWSPWRPWPRAATCPTGACAASSAPQLTCSEMVLADKLVKGGERPLLRHHEARTRFGVQLCRQAARGHGRGGADRRRARAPASSISTSAAPST